MIYFTSDTHFFHKNILEYCPNRQFKSVDEHDSYLMSVWNRTISPTDLVYFLGDFSFCSADTSSIILDELNGQKILIEGNHDRRNLKNDAFRSKWKSIHKYYEIEQVVSGVRYNIILSHFPFEDWNWKKKGSIHLHGHSHTSSIRSTLTNIENRIDVGVDSKTDLSPWSMSEIIENSKRSF